MRYKLPLLFGLDLPHFLQLVTPSDFQGTRAVPELCFLQGPAFMHRATDPLGPDLIPVSPCTPPFPAQVVWWFLAIKRLEIGTSEGIKGVAGNPALGTRVVMVNITAALLGC